MLLENPSAAASQTDFHEESASEKTEKKKFYALTPNERLTFLEAQGAITAAESLVFQEMALDKETSNHLIENQISEVEIPLGVGLNLQVNGKRYNVPLATEEPSVIAAMSNGAKMAGPITTTSQERLLRGQIVFMDVQDPEAILAKVESEQATIFAMANETYPSIVKRGGGLRRVIGRNFVPAESELATAYVSIDLLVDVKDAMGANIINSILEGVADLFRKWFPEEEILFSILSNLATESLVTATCSVPFDKLSKTGNGRQVAEKIVHAADFAKIDPYRAATHNKGIMNGVEALILATGNDTRAVSAACHGYAVRNGRVQGLTSWTIIEDRLIGSITLPLAIATVGGATKILPKAQAALALTGVETASELASLAASVGLVQNLAALRALVSEGIQQGHMSMQARSLAISVGAKGTEIEQLAAKLRAATQMNQEQARKFLTEIRN
jgi:hydroxymethylglutaryl-CoA reductase/acetyl-CoA C-acetyltransferase